MKSRHSSVVSMSDDVEINADKCPSKPIQYGTMPWWGLMIILIGVTFIVAAVVVCKCWDNFPCNSNNHNAYGQVRRDEDIPMAVIGAQAGLGPGPGRGEGDRDGEARAEAEAGADLGAGDGVVAEARERA